MHIFSFSHFAQVLQEVVLCGQKDVPVQSDSEPCFCPKACALVTRGCQGTAAISSESLEQLLSEHMTSQALQWYWGRERAGNVGLVPLHVVLKCHSLHQGKVL